MPEITSVKVRVVKPAKSVNTDPVMAEKAPVTKYIAVTIARQSSAAAARTENRIF